MVRINYPGFAEALPRIHNYNEYKAQRTCRQKATPRRVRNTLNIKEKVERSGETARKSCQRWPSYTTEPPYMTNLVSEYA